MKRTMQTVSLLIFLSGCAAYADLEKDYSRSYYQAMTGQILNPAASKNLNPVTGLPGDAAAAGMEKYSKTFNRNGQKPAPPSVVLPVVPQIPGGRDGYEK